MSMDRPDAHELCAAVAQRIERNEPDLTARIRAELPSYTRLSESEHRRTVHELARRLLTGIADREGRLPNICSTPAALRCAGCNSASPPTT